MERVAVLGGIVGLIGSGVSFALGAVGSIDPAAAVVGLATYGPLGVVSMFLLWRIREKDREHAAERQRDRDEDGQRWGEVISELRSTREVLARIETKLDERRRP